MLLSAAGRGKEFAPQSNGTVAPRPQSRRSWR